MAEYKILVVDDEEPIANILEFNLKKEGYDVIVANDGEKAVELAFNDNPDLILLDLMLPKKDGMEVCREVRAKKNIPIIMLTAKNSEIDKVLGLEFGADDYVTKPFSPKELFARVNAVLKRRNSSGIEYNLKFKGLEIDILARNVYIDGKKVVLTPKEYDLLFYLAKNKNIALSRDKLLSDVWGYDFFGDDRTIDTHIKNLRINLGPYRDFIVTLRGLGYKFEPE